MPQAHSLNWGTTNFNATTAVFVYSALGKRFHLESGRLVVYLLPREVVPIIYDSEVEMRSEVN